MAKSEMDLFDSTFLGPLLFIVNQHVLNHLVPEYFLLWVAFVSSLESSGRYFDVMQPDVNNTPAVSGVRGNRLGPVRHSSVLPAVRLSRYLLL